jgi:two-component sensor histidine kinase/ABC-type amino acid transport substrate-binding protein
MLSPSLLFRRLAIGAALCLVFSSYATAASPESPLVVVADDNYPPYAFRDAHGVLQGIVVDQWRAWEEVTGRTVDLRGMAWNAAQQTMQAGGADVIDTIFATPERLALYVFGRPYATIESSVFFHKSISGFAKITDLKGFRVAVKEGDALINDLKANDVVDFAYYPSYEAIVRAAASGEVKVFCIDRPPALYFLDKFGIENDFRFSVSIPGGEFHRAVLKGRQDLLEAVQKGFDAIPGAAYSAINRKWFGSELLRPMNLKIVLVSTALILVLALVFLVVAAGLRRRIAAATSQLRQKLEELEASQARNRAFIAALPDILFTLDREGRYLDYSTASMDQLILPPEKFLGKLITELELGPGLGDRLLGCIRTALDEERLVVTEYEAVVTAGRRRFEGRFVPLDADRVILIARDITEERRQKELLLVSLAEKECLLREVHHRVKNNLQVISSLVSLQETSRQDAREQSRDTQARIRSMARLHELLYGSGDLSSIDSAEYIQAIAGEISGSSETVRIRVEAQEDNLSIDEAMLFGLIVTELLTNALKYAYPAGAAGDITVSYSRTEGERRLSIRDEGVGMAPDFDPAHTSSLGFTLVHSLAAQLGGKLSLFETNPGKSRPGLGISLVVPIAAPGPAPGAAVS